MFDFLKRFWLWIVFALCVVAIVCVLVFVPGASGASVPFFGILVGLVWQTIVPYVIEAFRKIQETGEWLKFERQYWTPPIAGFIIETILVIGVFISAPGVFENIAKLGFVPAVAFGIAGHKVLRDVQKGAQVIQKT